MSRAMYVPDAYTFNNIGNSSAADDLNIFISTGTAHRHGDFIHFI
jgi:hypothetical protein